MTKCHLQLWMVVVWLLFKFGWILIFLLVSYSYDLFHFSNKLIFHDVFVFFITSFIHFVAHATKIITLQLDKVCMIPNSSTYRLFNTTYKPVCICYLLTMYIYPMYLRIIYMATYLINRYLHTYIPRYPLAT